MISRFFSSRPNHPLADAKELKRTIAELPSDNAFKAVDEIHGWFESLNHADDFRVDYYFEIVRQLDEAAQPHLRRLTRDYLHSPRLSKTDERRLWSINYSYWVAVAGLYQSCLDQVEQRPKDKGIVALTSSLPLIAARLMAAYVAQLKWAEYRYGPIGDGIWYRLGQLYLAAELAAYGQKPLQLYPNSPRVTSVVQQYLQALVFYASSMDCLMPLEIELADRLISHFLSGFVFSEDFRSASVYWVDAASAFPPARLARSPGEVISTLRFFSPGNAPQALNELIHRVERGDVPQNLDLGGPCLPKVLLPVLKHLALYWAAQPPLREHKRHAAKMRIAVLNGFDDCFAVFAGGVARLGKERVADSWVVENVCFGGFGAGIEGLPGDWLKVGALLNIQPEGGENWVLGVLRRYCKSTDLHANVGIESISRQAQSVELRPCRTGFSGAGSIPGIWLRDASASGEARMVLPFASFDLRESLEFSLDGRNYLLTPIELEESAKDYEIARFREHVADLASR